MKRICSTIVLLALVATAAICRIAADPGVSLELTYPAGKSPKVFTSGWLFGAKCVVGGKDFSSQVQWSGTGKFSPKVGAKSRPTFSKPGANKIVLTVKAGSKKVSKSYKVVAVSPAGYACMGDSGSCAADSHGCPACPHKVVGAIAQGSPHVLVRGKPAARVGDIGTHFQPHVCCGAPGTFSIISGDTNVLIDGKPAARFGDKTRHCGGVGKVGGLTMVPGEDDIEGVWTGTTTFTTIKLPRQMVKGKGTGSASSSEGCSQELRKVVLDLKGRPLRTTMTFDPGNYGYGELVININAGSKGGKPVKVGYHYNAMHGQLQVDDKLDQGRLVLSGDLEDKGTELAGKGIISLKATKDGETFLMEGPWTVRKKK